MKNSRGCTRRADRAAAAARICRQLTHPRAAYSGLLDTRMMLYCRTLPESPLTGDVIPGADLRRSDLSPRDTQPHRQRHLQPHDPDTVMQVDFLNARARSPALTAVRSNCASWMCKSTRGRRRDLCCGSLAGDRALCEGKWSSLQQRKRQTPTANLRSSARRNVPLWLNERLDDVQFLAHFGVSDVRADAGQLWTTLLRSTASRRCIALISFCPATNHSRIRHPGDQEFARH